MQYEDKVFLSKARLETAKSCLADAKTLVNAESYKSAANRSYYAVFHSMRAVLALDEFDSKKHSGVIAEFRKRYIKANIFSDNISRIIGDQFDARTHSDYDDFYVISKEFTLEQINEAESMIIEIEKYLNKKYNQNN